MSDKKMTPEAATALRKPFPPESVGKLPKPTAKENRKGHCGECGGWHGLPAVHLDYVGHAAVTDRLLTVDREWTWRPFAADEIAALPPQLRDAGLWIMLTVCGVTKPGFGDAQGKTGPNAVKEMIGDAIRNAAMRFGVRLDLWAKENLVEFEQAARAAKASEPDGERDLLLNTSGKLARAMFAGIRNAGISDPKAFMSEVTGRPIGSSKELTEAEARRILDHLPDPSGADTVATDAPATSRAVEPSASEADLLDTEGDDA